MSSQVSEIAFDLSNLSHKLHPSRLQTLGLTESVRLLCREISQHRQLNVQFSSVDLPHGTDPGVALCLYRIAQEALHNIAKHSQARNASVHLTHEDNHVHLHIADSGVGFDPITIDHGGLGLMSMRERVGILRGKLVIHASPGQGTRIGVDPIPKPKLTELLRKMRMTPRQLLRTKEPVYKTLKLAERDLPDEEIVDLMVEHPDLIQRPIVEKGARAILARPAERVKEIL